MTPIDGSTAHRGVQPCIATFALAALLVLASCATSGPGLHGPDVPYVVTPDAVGAEMLKLAAVTARDIVYDLGSGDGRLVIAAARDLGAYGVGVEIDPRLIGASRESAQRAGVVTRTEFVWQDLFAVSVAPASVVTLYLLPEINLRLRPKLLAELSPGSRVVSHNFDMGDWTPDRTQRVRAPDGMHTVYLWVIPADVAGRWRLTARERAWTLTLRQQYQRLGGELSTGETPIPIRGTLRGAEIELSALDSVAPLRLRGRVLGDALTGTMEADGAAPVSWSARRDVVKP
jgi:SAM-dependent methyltransferase